jgi:hypothetical protein
MCVRATLAIALVGAVASTGCNGCRGCGGGHDAARVEIDEAAPPAAPAPSAAVSEAVRAPSEASAPSARPTGRQPLPKIVNATVTAGKVSNVESMGAILSNGAHGCYRLVGPSGKTSLGGVTLRIDTDAQGNIREVTPVRAEVDKVVLDCIVNNVKRTRAVTAGEPASISVDIVPPPAPTPTPSP